MTRIGNETVERFAAQVAGAEPAPGGGACAAVACALGAGLVEMAAALTLSHSELIDRHPRMDEIARRAMSIRARALELADCDVAAYATVLEALTRPAGADREASLADALSHASDVPMEIAELAAEVTAMAQELQRDGNPNLSGDAAVGAHVASAACLGAAGLVEINLHDRPHDPRRMRARALTAQVAPDERAGA